MIGVRCRRDRELRMRTCVVDLGEPALVNGIIGKFSFVFIYHTVYTAFLFLSHDSEISDHRTPTHAHDRAGSRKMKR